MTNAEKELAKRGYSIVYNDSSDAMPIDFAVMDKEDNIAWIWGTSKELDWECNHPDEWIEFGDIDEQGQCLLCGQFCDWHHTEDEEGNKVPAPHEWHPRRSVGGLIGKYLGEVERSQI